MTDPTRAEVEALADREADAIMYGWAETFKLTPRQMRTMKANISGAISGIVEAERKRYVILRRQITAHELADALLAASQNADGCCIAIPLEIKP